MHKKYEKGWLDRQFRLAKETLEGLPAWLREEVERGARRYDYRNVEYEAETYKQADVKDSTKRGEK